MSITTLNRITIEVTDFYNTKRERDGLPVKPYIRPKMRPWTTGEKRLAAQYPLVSIAELQTKLNRTPDAIRRQIYLLSHSKR